MSESERDQYYEQRVEAAKTKEVLSRLTTSEAWHMICGVIDKQVEMLSNMVLFTPLDGDNSVYKQEFDKGQIAGLRILKELPKRILEDAENTLESIPHDEDEGEVNG